MYTFQQAQTLDPLCADVYIHRGQTNLLTGNLAAAEKDFSEAIRLQPNCSVAHVSGQIWSSLPFTPLGSHLIVLCLFVAGSAPLHALP